MLEKLVTTFMSFDGLLGQEVGKLEEVAQQRVEELLQVLPQTDQVSLQPAMMWVTTTTPGV